jgi:hypothetical protein
MQAINFSPKRRWGHVLAVVVEGARAFPTGHLGRDARRPTVNRLLEQSQNAQQFIPGTLAAKPACVDTPIGACILQIFTSSVRLLAANCGDHMRNFFRRLVAKAVVLAICTLVSIALHSAILQVAPKLLDGVSNGLHSALESLQVTEIGMQYLLILGVYQGPDTHTKAYDNCVSFYKPAHQKASAPRPNSGIVPKSGSVSGSKPIDIGNPIAGRFEGPPVMQLPTGDPFADTQTPRANPRRQPPFDIFPQPKPSIAELPERLLATSDTECSMFMNRGPITGWVRGHLTDYLMEHGAWGWIGAAITSIAALVDLVWITFWQYGVVPRIMGLIELALGFAIAARIAIWWTDGNPKRRDDGPMPLIRAGLFCVGVVLCACLVAAITYGFGALVANALAALAYSLRFVSELSHIENLAEVRENGWTGGVMSITAFFLIQFFMKGIEQWLEAIIEGFQDKWR